MANAVSSVDVPLDLFAGLDLELSPPDVPEGVSPANNDVVYAPGRVSTRPGLQHVLASIFTNGPLTYQKSFVQPTGTKMNLYFTSGDGNLWVENVSFSPGSATILYSSAGATYASSVTANGREYIMLSDGKHGADICLEYDGTNLYRLTQDGPGAPPTVTSVALPASQMAASGNTLTRQNNTVTCNTATAHGLQVGYQAQISHVPDSNATTVNQTNNSSTQTNNNTYWGLNSGQYRSNFNPGTSPLSAFFATGFGFTIPSAATILGVIVNFGVNSQSSSTGTVAQVALWYLGAQEGTAKSPATPITTSIVYTPYGSAADLWGAALTPAIVNDPSFGFAISCTLTTSRAFLNFPFSVTVYYTLSGSGTVAQITSIVLENEVNPGLARVTTTQPHGLIPNIYISLVGVQPSVVANISAAQWSAGFTTITTATSHNLNIGAVVQLQGVTTSTSGTTFSFNGTYTVLAVPSPNQLVFAQIPITATDPDVINATASTGTVSITWPISSNAPAPNYFLVQSCPTPTTFYIPLNYSDATWTTGTVGFIWEGTFFVTAVPSATSFQYQQYGPNGATTAVGTVTPWGQAAPGIHQVRQSFLLADGTITAPSPPQQFIANGGQYLQVSNLAIGPSPAVVGRVLQFTGAGGAFFFHVPIPAQVNGIVVSTSTQVNDNITTSVLLDFSDNTLYGTGAGGAAFGTADSIPGNNLAAQVVLGPAAGVFAYASRLLVWGERNKVQNLLNMGFDGGSLLGNISQPLGWTVNPTYLGTGLLVASRLADAWQVTLGSSAATYGQISQSAYVDASGAPILLQNQTYNVRFWANLAGVATTPSVQVSVTSVLTGFSSTASIPITASANGAYYQASLSAAMPSSIPSDLTIKVWAGGTSTANATVTIDDLEFIYAQQPYLDNIARISYDDNFGAFDGETGKLGPKDDLSPIRNFGVIRRTLYMVTGTGLHETQDNDQTEPSGWDVDQVADNCGAFSIASVGRNPQGIGSAGKTWMMWSGPDGAQVFFGEIPVKITQEIEPLWDAIPDAQAFQSWTKNDETNKRCYFGIPTVSGTSMYTVVLDYRNLNGETIANNPPVHISFTGKMIASDLTRKWTTWTVPAYSGELLYHGATQPQITFGCTLPGGITANAYTLNALKYHDDDFGIIPASYTTYFFVSHEAEAALQVGSHRKVYTMAAAYITGVGTWTATPLMAAITNPQNTSQQWPLSLTQPFDQDFGINVETTRCAFQIQAQPLSNSQDSYFSIEKLVINLSKAPWAPVRGSMTGGF